MDKFYIVTNHTKDREYEVTKEIKTYIEEHGRTCILGEPTEERMQGADCVLVLGGDGTLLQAARELISYDIPLLGVNLGTLGYLTEVEVHNVRQALDQLFADDCTVKGRMMLRGEVKGYPAELALNDIVVTSYSRIKLLHFDVYVNGELLNSYQADGMIISTPTGSTAYNLSAGGPILAPNSSIIVLTPICSHALNTSSIVFSSDDIIEIEITHGRNSDVEEAAVTFDGAETIQIRTGERIRIEKAREVTRLVGLIKVSFLETLRRKMKGN